MKNIRLCASIKSNDANEIIEICRKYPFVEIRLDDSGLDDDELKAVFSVPNCRKIVACRRAANDEEKLKLLVKSIDYGADTIDLEYDFRLADLLAYEIMSRGKKSIVSAHFIDEFPSEAILRSIAAKAQSIGADYLKIAAACSCKEMLLDFIALYAGGFGNFPRERSLFVPMGSGTQFARLAALEFGSPFIYCSCDGKTPTAEGQLPYSAVNNLI